ncbi:MAG: 2-amino-4-hydroxy-6-hydroxymethyldihydropteridine diphosphokinase [Fusobacteria bacterium]|nr:2-amino-4-hydroxy-6-hydroxymethyldihydropteridine diphosphokinase [Fusobacteriota bacterium]
MLDKICLKNLEFYGYHGFYKEENDLGQRFRVSVEAYCDLSYAKESGDLRDSINYVEIFEVVKEVFFSKKYKILEELSYDIGKKILKKFIRVKKVTVEVKKPEIPVPVTCDYFSITQEIKREEIAYIGLGSNMGDRIGYLDSAVRQLNYNQDIEVLDLSSVYETEPFGYTDQDSFLNMVVKIKTSLDPLSLLKYCNYIEGNLFRKRDVRWGPRTIDIDVLTYGDIKYQDEVLTIPHPGILERAFVMIPLLDVADSELIIDRAMVQEKLKELDDSGVKLFKKDLSY